MSCRRSYVAHAVSTILKTDGEGNRDTRRGKDGLRGMKENEELKKGQVENKLDSHKNRAKCKLELS